MITHTHTFYNMSYFSDIIREDIIRRGGNLGHFNCINLSLYSYSQKPSNYRLIEKGDINN